MKLYSTVTSERSTKSQGGNKFIRAEFFIGDSKDSQQVMTIVLEPTGIFTIRDKNRNIFKVIEIRNLLLVDKNKR